MEGLVRDCCTVSLRAEQPYGSCFCHFGLTSQSGSPDKQPVRSGAGLFLLLASGLDLSRNKYQKFVWCAVCAAAWCWGDNMAKLGKQNIVSKGLMSTYVVKQMVRFKNQCGRSFLYLSGKNSQNIFCAGTKWSLKLPGPKPGLRMTLHYSPSESRAGSCVSLSSPFACFAA